MSSLLFEFPQGSSCGPLLYLLYLAEMFDVIADCWLVGQSYADDTQTYISVLAIDASVAMQRLTFCIDRIEQWMGRNQLKLNEDKTHIILIGTRQQLAKHSATNLHCLGFIVDSQMNMSDMHATPVISNCGSYDKHDVR